MYWEVCGVVGGGRRDAVKEGRRGGNSGSKMYCQGCVYGRCCFYDVGGLWMDINMVGGLGRWGGGVRYIYLES